MKQSSHFLILTDLSPLYPQAFTEYTHWVLLEVLRSWSFTILPCGLTTLSFPGILTWGPQEVPRRDPRRSTERNGAWETWQVNQDAGGGKLHFHSTNLELQSSSSSNDEAMKCNNIRGTWGFITKRNHEYFHLTFQLLQICWNTIYAHYYFKSTVDLRPYTRSFLMCY